MAPGMSIQLVTSNVTPSQFFNFSSCLVHHFELLCVAVGRDPAEGGKSECWWNYMGGYMLQVTINENRCMQELRQDILQGSARYLYVK
jgi:uncharacterized membrane protein